MPVQKYAIYCSGDLLVPLSDIQGGVHSESVNVRETRVAISSTVSTAANGQPTASRVAALQPLQHNSQDACYCAVYA
jgi:hypothetical protein